MAPIKERIYATKIVSEKRIRPKRKEKRGISSERGTKVES